MTTDNPGSLELRRRFAALPAPHPADRLVLRVGTMADYAQLAEHHYKANRPATATRVLTFTDPRQTATSRWRKTFENNSGNSGNSGGGEQRIVGVLVESLPSLACRMREWAMHERYGGHLSPRGRATLLNAEVRCISRVVVDPTWRGLGLAVRLVRAALAEPTTRVTEALAAMGRVNPFFERAGMTAYPRPPHAHDARLLAAMARFGFRGRDLALADALWLRMQQLAPADRVWLLAELQRWTRQSVGRAGLRVDDPREQLVLAREKLLLDPVYYLKVHDAGDDCV